MKKACFELGGSDPFVVLKDANMEQAVNVAYASRMANSGQVCCSAKRFIITAPVYDEFRDRLIEKIRATSVIGDPMDPVITVGPLASVTQRDTFLRQMDVATTEGGASLSYGDLNWRIQDPELVDGAFVAPLLLEGMDSNS